MLNMNQQDHRLARNVNNILSCVLNIDKPASSEWLVLDTTPWQNAQENTSHHENT